MEPWRGNRIGRIVRIGVDDPPSVHFAIGDIAAMKERATGPAAALHARRDIKLLLRSGSPARRPEFTCRSSKKAATSS